jgi:hypothetical protein
MSGPVRLGPVARQGGEIDDEGTAAGVSWYRIVNQCEKNLRNFSGV